MEDDDIYEVVVALWIGKRKVAEEVEFAEGRSHIPDISSRLQGRLVPQMKSYMTMRSDASLLTIPQVRVYRAVLRRADELHSLVGGGR